MSGRPKGAKGHEKDSHCPHPLSRIRPRRLGADAAGASVALTNDGTQTVKSVRLDFVFTDPPTGAEVNRIRHRSKKTLRPGDSVTTKKGVIPSPRHCRGDGMKVGAELTEVVYADGSVWRCQPART